MNTTAALLNRRDVSSCHGDHAVGKCLNISLNCHIANRVPVLTLPYYLVLLVDLSLLWFSMVGHSS